MKLNLKYILILNFIFFVFNISNLNAQTDNKSKSFKIGNNGKLSININSGDIKIKSWDKDEVLIRTDSKEELNSLKINQTGNEIQINTGSSFGSFGSIDLQISLPANIELDIKTSYGDIIIDGNINGKIICSTMGGDIITQNVQGNINIKTMGGDIKVGDITGETMISTLGGDIITGKLSGKGNIVTHGGDINIKEATNDLILKTNGGDIETGNIGGNANFVTHGGDINVKYLNGDGILNTFGGSIYVLGAKNNLNVKTNGGNLSLKNIIGSVTANSSAGDITIEFDPQKNGTSSINSSNGTITLFILGTAKISVDFKINKWGKLNTNEFGEYVQSDIPILNFEADKNNIKGTLIINGGGEKLTVKGSNSKLVIKELKK